MRKEFNEALGVPENQIDTAIKIYERILKIIPKDYDVSDLKDFKKKFRGDFKVGDVTFSTVEFEIDIEGAKQVKANWPDAILVFLEPPSWEELVARLEGRGTDGAERRAERLTLAQEELAAAAYFDVVIVNDQVESVVQKLIELAQN